MLSGVAQGGALRCEDLFGQRSALPENLDAMVSSLTQMDAHDDFAGMVILAERILILQPNNALALRKRAKALLRLGNWAEADVSAKALLTIDPNDVRALHMRAQILMRQQSYEQALLVLNQILTLQPNHTSTLGMLSNTLFKLKRYAEALPLLELRLAQSDHLPSLSMKAQALFHLQRYAEVIPVAAEVLKREPHFSAIYTVQLVSFFKLRRFQEAIVVADTMINIDLSDALVLSLKSQALIRLERYAEALQIIEARLQFQPNNSHVLAMQVHVLLKLVRFSEAASIVGRIEDGFFKSYYTAQIFIAQKQYSKAIELLKTLDSGLNVKWLLAQAYFLAGDMKNSRQSLLFIVQNSKTLQPRVVAALIKIHLFGEPTAMDPFLFDLTQQLPQKVLNKILAYQESLFWDFEPISQGPEISISNSFWDGLNERPVNGQTFNSTY
jgi:tetratricopeptide (TPR) repeat protein